MMIKLDRPVPVGDAHVIGYDPEKRQPVLTRGGSLWTLAQMQRAGWDDNEERFTPEELGQINDAIRTLGLPPELVNGTPQP